MNFEFGSCSHELQHHKNTSKLHEYGIQRTVYEINESMAKALVFAALCADVELGNENHDNRNDLEFRMHSR